MGELRKVGRPKIDKFEKRERQFNVRMRDDEFEKLLYLADFYDVSLADILRLGIKNNFELHKDGRDILCFSTD